MTEMSETLEKIDEILECEDATWCHGTIQGIRETVERTDRITDGQMTAIDNIYRKAIESKNC